MTNQEKERSIIGSKEFNSGFKHKTTHSEISTISSVKRSKKGYPHPPLTVWLGASGHSVNVAFATKKDTKDEISYNTDDYANFFPVIFQGSTTSQNADAWIDLLHGNIEYYSCMGTSILSLGTYLWGRAKRELVD